MNLDQARSRGTAGHHRIPDPTTHCTPWRDVFHRHRRQAQPSRIPPTPHPPARHDLPRLPRISSRLCGPHRPVSCLHTIPPSQRLGVVQPGRGMAGRHETCRGTATLRRQRGARRLGHWTRVQLP